MEDNTHILECKAAGTMMEWNIASKKMNAWLDYASLCLELARLVMRALGNWKEKTPVIYDSAQDYPGVRRLLQVQENISWRLFLDGCLVLEWAQVWQPYYDWISSEKSGIRWVIGLIRQLWDLEISTWEHQNSIIYDTPLVDIMSGTLSLDRALRREWYLGFDGDKGGNPKYHYWDSGWVCS